MKIELIRWQDLFHPGRPTYDYNMKSYLNRRYRPYANKKAFYMHIIARLRIGQSVIIKDLCTSTLRLNWIGYIKYNNPALFKYHIQELDDKVHKITRAVANKNIFLARTIARRKQNNRSKTMKTIRTVVENSQHWKKVPVGTLLRVRDEDARKVVDKHEAEYVAKAEWKKLRDNETNNNKGEVNAKD